MDDTDHDNGSAETNAVTPTTPQHVWSTVMLAFVVGAGVAMLLYSYRDGETGMTLAGSWMLLIGTGAAFVSNARKLHKSLHGN